ncbi:Ubiquitin carboxyl-terminal hydrolase 1 [Erysiphe neolycopersici]|uniref:ubiquitinyl hydrolase 1 n=1 Tax=Erysiphe neolycopersici TaxID=212602 RepID=A0A420HEJ9_9PEZI|nr:Ubiquitin carboxyl-terminal hydrolase 1 [Erysiphe neolycopersici]
MQPHKEQIYSIFDDNPNLDYTQFYQEDTHSLLSSIRTFLLMLVCFTTVVHQILQRLDFNVLPLSELLWNTLVFFTPSRLLDVIESYSNPPRVSNITSKRIPRTHAAKSEVMRRILSLDSPGGFIGSFAHAGRKRFGNNNEAAQGIEGRPAGLGNWDNSCYQNSILQGLASLKNLSEYLNRPIFKKNINEGDGGKKLDTKMTEALRKLIESLNDPLNNGTSLWTPALLKYMSSWQQQDAQEYFSKVLDEIDREISMAVSSAQKHEGFISSSSESGIQEISLKAEKNPLEGLIAQRVGCLKCGYSEGLSLIPFNCLTVPLGRCRDSSIFECLDEYTKLEIIEGVECGKCTLMSGKRLLLNIVEKIRNNPKNKIALKQCEERLENITKAIENNDYEEKTLLDQCQIKSNNRVSSTKTRQAVVARPPSSLVFHLNRSLYDEVSGDLRKNYCQVRFPKILDLGPWCLGSVGNIEDLSKEEWIMKPDRPMVASSLCRSRQKGPIYELRAVVTHYGRHENGHYVCYKKHPIAGTRQQQERWWRLSDEEVIQVSEENVLSQGGVFMLFYDCIESAGKLDHSIQFQDAIENKETSGSLENHSKSSDFEDLITQNRSHDGATFSNVPTASDVSSSYTSNDEFTETGHPESGPRIFNPEEFLIKSLQQSYESSQEYEIREKEHESRIIPTTSPFKLWEVENTKISHEGGRKNNILASGSHLLTV